MRAAYLIATMMTLWAASWHAAAGVPQLLNYQGQIAGREESAPNNPMTVTFAIYATPENGLPLWSETQVITHDQGVFHALLGVQTPFPEDLFHSDQRYLEIRLKDEPPFFPRQRIVSVAFALEAARAENATGDLTPQSLSIGSTKIDTSGALTTQLVRTDSLAVGGKGVIDRQGNWIGPPQAAVLPGMTLDTLIVRNFQESLSFGSLTWLDIDGSSDVLTAFVNLKKTSLLDAQFHAAISNTGGLFETRLVVEPLNPRGNPLANIGNISRFRSSASTDLGTLSNQAVVQLTPGLFRVFVQGQADALGALQTGILTIRIFSK